jgi:hypothetical protein
MSAKDRVLADLRVGCGGPRPVRAPRGAAIACRGWLQEAALRMLCNNLDPDNAETRLSRFMAAGRAARADCFTPPCARCSTSLRRDPPLHRAWVEGSAHAAPLG